jgi:hypothetical protein
MTRPAKSFSLDAFDMVTNRGRPRIARKKTIQVYLSEKGVEALAAIEATYQRSGIAAFRSRHALIERLLIDHVDEALNLEAALKTHGCIK